MSGARANLAAHIVNTTDSARRRLEQPERPVPWAAIIVGLCALPLIAMAVRMALA